MAQIFILLISAVSAVHITDHIAPGILVGHHLNRTLPVLSKLLTKLTSFILVQGKTNRLVGMGFGVGFFVTKHRTANAE